MSAPTCERHMITMDQLCVGLHVRLDSWLGHPFLFSSFRIKDQQQIDTLRSLGLTEIEYLPHKSTASPASPSVAKPPVEQPVQEATATLESLMQEKRERIDTLSKERQRIQAAERQYVKTAEAIKNIMRLANQTPAQAVAESGAIAHELVRLFVTSKDPYIHLMGDHVADESAHYHGLNVTVLSLILARALRVPDVGLVRDIAQGAILHDIGKSMIPSQVLLKTDALTRAESSLLQMHPAYGLKILEPAESLSPGVRQIVFAHHERADGSGFPRGLKGDAIHQAAAIVAIADTYDNLCNHRVLARAKTPSEALSFMYKNGQGKFDAAALAAFIKSLGVFPPGTIVRLRSGKVGIVMSIDSADLLHPDLMLYDDTIPKESAAIVNLKRDLDDEIEQTVRPAALPPAVHAYLSPRKRVCYFVDHDGRS